MELNAPRFTLAELQQALEEAAQRLSEQGVRVTPAQVEAALLTELGLTSRDGLLNSPWTPDIIIHHILHVDFDTGQQ